ncbi:MAG: hypothetical protein OEX04_10395 [Acidimicrobiia bacterium]|nr:hypothetical protein [Acidimicrobiia bacterium]MDH4307880.1 hypothetical protein [Acidimicrobiia bacterium]
MTEERGGLGWETWLAFGVLALAVGTVGFVVVVGAGGEPTAVVRPQVLFEPLPPLDGLRVVAGTVVAAVLMALAGRLIRSTDWSQPGSEVD